MNPRITMLCACLLAAGVALTGCDDDTENNDGPANVGARATAANDTVQAREAGDNTTAGQSDDQVTRRVRFIAIGDSGEGGERAQAVGQAMGQVCDAKRGGAGAPERAGCDFVVGLGDNIYESGARSVDDPQFVEKFEQPFAPVNRPFYMVLGNHDNTGYFAGDGAGNDHGDIEVAYTYFDGRPTDRWTMPERYYQQSIDATDDQRPLVELFGLDSNPIAGGFADADPEFAYSTYGMRQYNWAIDALSRSQAIFKVALAHHPYLSNGDHGNAGAYEGLPSAILPVLAGQRWKEFLEGSVCDRADFFLAGHDHDLQLPEPVAECGRTRFVVSGAASKTRSLDDKQRNDVLFQQGGVSGFFWMEAIAGDPDGGTPPRMCVETYVVDVDGAGTGVVADGLPQPDFRHCYAKRAPAGLQAGSAFRNNATDGQAMALPAPDESYQPDWSGPLGAFRSHLREGMARAIANQADDDGRQAMRQMADGLDTLAGGLDGLTGAMMNSEAGGEAMNQSIQAVLAGARELDGMNASRLPEPFNRLGGVFDAFADGLGNASAMDSDYGTIDDIAFIAGPLVKLARNLHNIVEGAEDQADQVPVLMGLTKVLSDVSLGLSQGLSRLAALQFGGTNDAVVGAVQQTLEHVVDDVLWLESVDQATLPGDFLSSTLASITREVAAQLDRLVEASTPLVNLLSPVTDILGGLLEGLLGGGDRA